MKIDCEITTESSKVINENIIYMNKLVKINFDCKNWK